MSYTIGGGEPRLWMNTDWLGELSAPPVMANSRVYFATAKKGLICAMREGGVAMNAAEQTPGCDLPHIRFFGLGSDAGGLPALAEVGGKAINLCKLTRAKLPVPPGFVVTTRAYLGFIGEDGLGARIAELAATIEEGDAAAIETVSAQIRGAAGRAARCTNRSPRKFSRLTAGLRDAGGERVAVRSSATAEDLPEASFAGQQDTYLNVRGEEALLKAVQSCWGSLWTARAVAYRAKQKTPAEGLAMAVVVQQMVMADAAGVIFTANPVTGAGTKSSSTRPGGWARPSWAARSRRTTSSWKRRAERSRK